jgi:hypothetical protein
MLGVDELVWVLDIAQAKQPALSRHWKAGPVQDLQHLLRIQYQCALGLQTGVKARQRCELQQTNYTRAKCGTMSTGQQAVTEASWQGVDLSLTLIKRSFTSTTSVLFLRFFRHDSSFHSLEWNLTQEAC